MTNNFDNNRHFMHPGDPHACETVKKTEIKDNYGHTRFAVVITDFDDLEHYAQHDDFRFYDKDYQVEVLSYCYSEDPLLLVSKKFERYSDAQSFYNENVAKYTQLCKAETRHWQDMNLYADHIGYVHAKCCKYCEFSKAYKEYDEHKHDIVVKYRCTNNALFKADSMYNESFDHHHHHDHHHNYHDDKYTIYDHIQHTHHICHGDHIDHITHNPSYCHIEHKHNSKLTFMPVEPDVEPTNVCDAFKEKV